MALKVENLETPLRQSATYMEGSISKRFRNQGGSLGKWAPLSAATLKRHPHRVGGKILSDTGDLKRSVTAGHNQRITKKTLHYGAGSNLVYAGVHQFGWNNNGRGHIPARPFLYFDKADERIIKQIFTDYVEGLS